MKLIKLLILFSVTIVIFEGQVHLPQNCTATVIGNAKIFQCEDSVVKEIQKVVEEVKVEKST